MFISLCSNAGSYHIDGEFNGCDYDMVYPIQGGGVMVCNEYNYFYEYSPEVIADGRRVILVGNNKVSAELHNGSVIETKVNGEFNGCESGKPINFTNGLVFVCSSYGYAYGYNAEVRISYVDNNPPIVFIKDKQYRGKLYKR